jgi:excisionase family DNA binding protein
MEKTSDPEKAAFTVEEAARYIGLSRAGAYGAVRTGVLPHIRIGKRILIPKAALIRWLETAGAAVPATTH